jgi:hypothetical protein
MTVVLNVENPLKYLIERFICWIGSRKARTERNPTSPVQRQRNSYCSKTVASANTSLQEYQLIWTRHVVVLSVRGFLNFELKFSLNTAYFI